MEYLNFLSPVSVNQTEQWGLPETLLSVQPSCLFHENKHILLKHINKWFLSSWSPPQTLSFCADPNLLTKVSADWISAIPSRDGAWPSWEPERAASKPWLWRYSSQLPRDLALRTICFFEQLSLSVWHHSSLGPFSLMPMFPPTSETVGLSLLEKKRWLINGTSDRCQKSHMEIGPACLTDVINNWR